MLQLRFCREGPQGTPKIAEFAKDTQDSVAARFDPVANKAHVTKVMNEILPNHFAPADRCEDATADAIHS